MDTLSGEATLKIARWTSEKSYNNSYHLSPGTANTTIYVFAEICLRSLIGIQWPHKEASRP